MRRSKIFFSTTILFISDFPLLCYLIYFLLHILLEEEGVNLPSIAGGAVAGGMTLAIIVIVIVFMFRRYTKNGKFCNHQLPRRLLENRGGGSDIWGCRIETYMVIIRLQIQILITNI